MEFDWLNVNFDLSKIPPKDIEESFEDPFSLRLLPENNEEGSEARYFCLGKSLGSRPIFSVFWTDGKRYRVIAARDMSPEELNFYERKNAELL
ncbi:MAG: BrnT family toxin [Verrucomicrobiales bacterium]